MEELFDSMIMLSLVLVIFLSSFSVIFAENELKESDQSSLPEQKKLCIIFSHDTHSNLDGLAKEKTLINRIKKHNPEPLIVDGGDFSMGTLYQTVFQDSASELRVLGALGYDAVAIGNHEFDYRSKGLANMLNAAKKSGDILPDVFFSNVDWKKSLSDSTNSSNAAYLKKAMDGYGIKEYKIYKKNGLKIAVFSILGIEACSYAPMSSVQYYDPILYAKSMVKKIMKNEKADMIVCLSHSGTSSNSIKSEDELLAKAVPQIDVIISGHSHTTLRKPIIIGKTMIVSCGRYARRLGVMEVVQKDSRFALSKYKLVSLDNSVRSNKTILAFMDDMKQQVQRSYLNQFGYKFDQVLAYNPHRFTPYVTFGLEQQEYPLGDIISDSYKYAVKHAEGINYIPVDVSIVPSGVIRASLGQGKITVSDVFNVSAIGSGKDGLTGYPLVSCYLTGQELKVAAEVDASVPNIMPDAQLFMSGLTYTFNPNRLVLNKVINVSLETQDGVYEKIDDDKLYRVVSDLYTAQMLSALEKKSFGLLSVTPKDKDGKPITNFEDFIIYTKNGELKEWVALASYLESFPKENGVSVIPEYYSQTHGRKNVTYKNNIIDLIKYPNKIFLGLVAVTAIALSSTAVTISGIARKSKNKKLKTRLKFKENAPI